MSIYITKSLTSGRYTVTLGQCVEVHIRSQFKLSERQIVKVGLMQSQRAKFKSGKYWSKGNKHDNVRLSITVDLTIHHWPESYRHS